MMPPIVFLDEARAEFDAAADWYERQKPGLGADFIGRVQDVLDRIAAMPRLHQVIFQDVRRAVVKKFPYTVLYQIESDHILVIAIFHGKRDPSIWQSRI
jgi:plasmid stabilization system protein ParE